MEDFVSHADLLLAALLDREALPNHGTCQLCPDRKQAIWRCKDCTFPLILCRSCMRHSHQINPLHRIECWTGKYFRAANLWEVGGYMLVPHHNILPLCKTLATQKNMLEIFAVVEDQEEQRALTMEPGILQAAAVPMVDSVLWDDVDDDINDYHMDVINNLSCDDMPVDELTNMPVEKLPDTPVEELLDMPVEELPDMPVEELPNMAREDLPNRLPEQRTPRHDALGNDYTRVIHTNGIHQIALVTCGCLGSNNIHADLVYAKLMPASFSKYKTIFTTDVLDDFRLSNLECKASAYQYFQKLRRLTAPTAPATASNFYQELLRMSRLWRWLKKRKWAGHGHVSEGQGEPSPLLANFCPACPQPDINLPEDWQHDPVR
jgi:hypothetical protein